MKPNSLVVLVAVGVALIWPRSALAGMGAVTLEEIHTYMALSGLTHQRLQAISFFTASIFACAGLVYGIWNSLRSDFPRLPHLSYLKSLGLIVLWGLLFLLVLTMVAGARELMTPGAWEKKGLLYELKAAPTGEKSNDTREESDAQPPA